MSTSAMVGSCGCGTVRFEVSEPLLGSIYCHCTRCQKRTGTAYQASALAAPGSVTVTAGAEHLRDWEPGGLARTYCELCGAHMFGRDAGTGAISVVRLAAIDGDPGVRPLARQFVAYHPAWAEIPDDGLPRFDEDLPRPSAR
jgi:hypothetical protein